MVKLSAPCMSFDAAGSLGNRLTFSKLRKTNYATRFHTPRNPQSAGQSATRIGRQQIIDLWSTLSDDEQASWETIATRKRLSPVHAFMQVNCRRWASDLLPKKTPDATGIIAYTSFYSNWNLTGETYRAGILCEGEPAKPFTTQLLCSTSPGFEPERSLTVSITNEWVWSSWRWYCQVFWTRPDSQTWYNKIRYSTPSGSTSQYFSPGSYS